MPWQLCSASITPAGTIQVSLAARKTIPENILELKLKLFYLSILQSLHLGSLLCMMYMTRGFWAVIVYRPVQERHWAQCGLPQSKWSQMRIVPK